MDDNAAYLSRIKRHTPSSPIVKNCLLAALFGAGISFASEWLFFLYSALGAEENDAYLFVAATLVFLSALLSGIGVYDRVAKHAGAGLLVPTTGFANAVVAPALDARAEGLVTGVGAAIFTVAGPVLLFASLLGTLYGSILLLIQAFGGTI